ncbi:Protein PTST [Carex littledalei]|uniref:Protein PTST n=1 Tax=Carex littledalei TaxID=544730 RepID=A0A833R1E2_9POAL|nr:Protein PTST [Carex littledalei]
MAICHLSHCHPLPTTFLFSPKRLDPPVKLKVREVSSVRRLAFVRSSAESSDEVRISRNRKSDEQICEELRDFISLAGLPLKRMPSLKVLSDNGRKDLAKVIKKRGYKSFSNLFLSSVTNDEVEENLSDGILDYEDDYYLERIEGVTPSSEFSVMHQVDGHGINNGTHANENVEANLVAKAKQTNDTDEANFIERGKGRYLYANNIELLKLQEKARAKIANVELTIKDNCRVIHDAEDKLKGLKEVRIEFMADAEVVEIAGSFNGWQHRLKMNLDQSSNSEDPSNFRQLKVWTTELLLYPGVYQIKFVVDGNWRVDLERELVTIGEFANNVLTVEK